MPCCFVYLHGAATFVVCLRSYWSTGGGSSYFSMDIVELDAHGVPADDVIWLNEVRTGTVKSHLADLIASEVMCEDKSVEAGTCQ